MNSHPTAPSGRIVAIYLKRAHRGPMDPVAEATLVASKVLDGGVIRVGDAIEWEEAAVNVEPAHA